jgi:hypothetical protein
MTFLGLAAHRGAMYTDRLLTASPKASRLRKNTIDPPATVNPIASNVVIVVC